MFIAFAKFTQVELNWHLKYETHAGPVERSDFQAHIVTFIIAQLHFDQFRNKIF